MLLKDSVKNIRAELDQVMKEMDEAEEDYDPLLSMNQEEYAEMYKRIRAELMEELVQNGKDKTE
jgi:hypothetical protein